MGLWNWIKRLFGIGKRQPKIYPTTKTYGPLKFVFKSNYGLLFRTELKAVRDHNKYVHNFIRAHKRGPTRYELGRIIRGASHETIKYRKGKSGHWGRQKIRRYLFNLHKIDYTMR